MADGYFDLRFYNIIVLGISFMLIFTAFQTCSMVEKTVLDSAAKNENFTGNGYTSLGILYAVFSISNWAAPSFVCFAGPRVSMFVGSLFYFLFVLSFLKPMVWSLYLGSVLVGFGAAILWTAQGTFFTINSDSQTSARNSGIFWALSQCSLLFGNLYCYFVFKGQSTITDTERTNLFLALSAAGLAGSLCLLALRRPRIVSSDDALNLNASVARSPDTPLTALKKAFALMKTKEVLLLCLMFAYTGLEMTFYSGVYGTSVSHNLHFGNNANGLLGISGIFIGVGEIVGGGFFGMMAKKTNKHGRDPIIVLGYVAHIVAFYIVFLNLPASSPIEDTLGPTYITSNEYLAIVASFLLGFGDSSFNTQIYSLIGTMFPEDSSAGFAIFKFMQSVTAAVGFYYSNVLLLQWQLLILVISGTVGIAGFILVEWGIAHVTRSGYEQI
ncbi:unnamed protein product [Candidula unifasciata]|uniref:UNC93-like protein MFSD11 n=1 Tax=Candidula unifasciata TaxID=100452 RepID=A0A8S3ZKQ9_9EUPU|nr:unnamed protein product [Candidula unifasciata]